MKFAKLLTMLLAAALLGLVAVSSSPADAAGTSVPAATGTHATSARDAAARRTVKRTVYAQVLRTHGQLIMKGKVTPPKGPVIISKATKCDRKTGVCNFKKYRAVPVKDKHFSGQIAAPNRGNWYWQARYGSFKSAIWVTCKTSTDSCSKR